jgi:hypothetical protein
VRARLEALCRGLQDSNRAIKEESKLAQEAEMRKRAELSKQFQVGTLLTRGWVGGWVGGWVPQEGWMSERTGG